jgi:hypothetical protein
MADDRGHDPSHLIPLSRLVEMHLHADSVDVQT